MKDDGQSADGPELRDESVEVHELLGRSYVWGLLHVCYADEIADLAEEHASLNDERERVCVFGRVAEQDVLVVSKLAR